MNFPLVFMSFGVGVLIGLTSMGGAALMAPFLILVIGVQPVTAVGTDLVYGAITKIVGAWVHFKQGTVDLPVVKKLASGSIPGGIAGSLAVVLLPRMLTRFPQAILPVRTLQFLSNRGTIMWGVVVGFCVGATSVGSGSLLA